MGTEVLRKVALITGASRGVGFAAAKKIVSSFPHSPVYLTTKNQQVTDSLNTAMRDHFGYGSSSCRYIHLDIEDKHSVASVADIIGTEHSRLDILVNNAGVYEKPNRKELGRQARTILGTNYFGLKNVMTAMRSLLVAAGGARVVNMTSHLGHLSLINGNIHGGKELRIRLGNPGITEEELDGLMGEFIAEAEEGTWTNQGWPTCAYTVSKVGVNAYTRILQRSFDSAGEDVTVNSLHPGTSHSKIHQGGVISLEEGAEAVKECACGPARGIRGKVLHRGQVLWHNMKPVNWEDAVHRPSLL